MQPCEELEELSVLVRRVQIVPFGVRRRRRLPAALLRLTGRQGSFLPTRVEFWPWHWSLVGIM
jgi:hypothetical protein